MMQPTPLRDETGQGETKYRTSRTVLAHHGKDLSIAGGRTHIEKRKEGEETNRVVEIRHGLLF